MRVKILGKTCYEAVFPVATGGVQVDRVEVASVTGYLGGIPSSKPYYYPLHLETRMKTHQLTIAPPPTLQIVFASGEESDGL